MHLPLKKWLLSWSILVLFLEIFYMKSESLTWLPAYNFIDKYISNWLLYIDVWISIIWLACLIWIIYGFYHKKFTKREMIFFWCLWIYYTSSCWYVIDTISHIYFMKTISIEENMLELPLLEIGQWVSPTYSLFDTIFESVEITLSIGSCMLFLWYVIYEQTQTYINSINKDEQ